MRRQRFAASILGAFALTAVPVVSAAPCAGFIDVDDSSGFCIHIEWLRNRAITLGCTATQYCPSNFVRRDQMAAFLYRLGVQNAFLQGGNAFGTTATLGTTDNRALQVNVNGSRALLVAPASNGPFGSVPNLVGGHPANKAAITCAGICLPTPEPVVGAVIGGGGHVLFPNRVTDSFGAVGGGVDNQAGNDDADHNNAAVATVGGGTLNRATGYYATIPGGILNVASGQASLAAGRRSEAHGDYSIALGRNAKVLGSGSFSFADSNDFDFNTPDANRFRVRATGGIVFVTDIDGVGGTGWSCITGAGSGWVCTSDRNQKQNLRRLDGKAVLERLAAMPVFEWYPKGRNAHVRHYGPMAQDFHAAFGLGDDDTMIGTQDVDGVALAAIQGLNAKLEKHEATLRSDLDARDAEMAALKSQLAALQRTVEVLMAHALQSEAIANAR